MKLNRIVTVLTVNEKTGVSLIMKVLKTLSDFERRVKLIPAYDEIIKIFDVFIEERNAKAKKITQVYCDEHNEKNKDLEGWKKLDPEELGQVPPELIPSFLKSIQEIENTEIKIKIPLKFTKEEIKESGIDFEEIMILQDFIKDFKKEFLNT